MIMFLLLPIFSALTSAEVICNPSIPRTVLPELASCDYAISYLEYISAQCGPWPTILTAQPGGLGAIRLPLAAWGHGPHYTPSTPRWCVILVLWQPRPGSRPPPPTLSDIFYFDAVVQAAKSIREVCFNEGRGWIPMIGREWIEPNAWIDVQFGVVIPPSGGDGEYGKTESTGGNVTVLLADGSNRTVVPSLIDGNDTCGRLIGLESEGSGVLK